MNCIRAASIFVASSLAASIAIAGEEDLLRRMTVNKLKASYALCDRAALAGALDRSQIMHCSVVYEELKRRAFHGDFDKLHAWWRAHSRK